MDFRFSKLSVCSINREYAAACSTLKSPTCFFLHFSVRWKWKPMRFLIISTWMQLYELIYQKCGFRTIYRFISIVILAVAFIYSKNKYKCQFEIRRHPFQKRQDGFFVTHRIALGFDKQVQYQGGHTFIYCQHEPHFKDVLECCLSIFHLT